MSGFQPTTSTLEWTGERMIPNSADAATELCHWQRYLYFRPWYDDAKMVDAGLWGRKSGQGFYDYHDDPMQ